MENIEKLIKFPKLDFTKVIYRLKELSFLTFNTR